MTFPPQKLIDGFVRFRVRHFDRGDSLFQQLVAQELGLECRVKSLYHLAYKLKISSPAMKE